ASMYNTGGNTVWISENGGDNWQRNTSIESLASINQNNGGFFFGTPFAMSPTNENEALMGSAGNVIQRSNDGGRNWTYSSNGFTGARVLQHGRAFDTPSGELQALFLVDFGALITQDNGQSFRTLAVPRFDARQTTYAGAVQPGSNAQRIITAAGTYDEQALIVTTDGGDSWRDTGLTGSFDFIGFDPDDANIVYAGRFKSENAGDSWQTLSTAVDNMNLQDGTLYNYDGNRLRESTDGGENWASPYPAFNCSIEGVVDLPNEPESMIAIGPCGVYKLIDNEWQQRGPANGIPNDAFGSQDTRAVAVSPANPDFVCIGKWIAYRGQANGVYCSDDGGEQWRAFMFDLAQPFTPWSLAFAPDGRLHMGSSHGNFILVDAD
ncbi:MAG: hypothetical protein AAGJ86_05710, partial [Pseudomonadota bacterium]